MPLSSLPTGQAQPGRTARLGRRASFSAAPRAAAPATPHCQGMPVLHIPASTAVTLRTASECTDRDLPDGLRADGVGGSPRITGASAARLHVEPEFLRADGADASPTSPMCRRGIGDAAQSSDPIYSDSMWKASDGGGLCCRKCGDSCVEHRVNLSNGLSHGQAEFESAKSRTAA
ncbi:unnamed protein product [Prorocentrum cordatum]|uniref:Uncharacterized protein n=1 Tax=Prorocentrum cordatum TaxID=2364126 RepID=A0ABN9UJG2_9DINO|nr:unnamed protein product [Polarella glacialis]